VTWPEKKFKMASFEKKITYWINLGLTTLLIKLAIWVIDSTRFNDFFKLILFNYIIAKIFTHKIDHQLNIGMFVLDYDNPVKKNSKQIKNLIPS